jgi:hypothetical protein
MEDESNQELLYSYDKADVKSKVLRRDQEGYFILVK